MIVYCPHCQQKYNAPDDMAGNVINCTKCGQEFVIEAEQPAAPVAPAAPPAGKKSAGTISCPDCGGTVSRRAPACPHCGAPIGEKKPGKRPAICSVLNVFGLFIMLFGILRCVQGFGNGDGPAIIAGVVVIFVALLMMTTSSLIARRNR